jgi:hypothetical protein
MARFRFKSDFGKAFEKETNKVILPITVAAQAALKEVGKVSVKEGRASIKGAGRFHGAWVTGFRQRFYKNRGLDAAVLIYHRIGLASVFETGVQIIGRPLLWLPVRRLAAFGKGNRSPRQLIAAGMKLVKVERPGKRPLLVESGGNPMFVGIDAVRLRKRFNLLAIIRRTADRMAEFYIRNVKAK